MQLKTPENHSDNKPKENRKDTDIIIYKTRKGGIKLEVKLKKQTVWLDAHQMAKIFNVNRPAIVKHINNIYKTGELNRKATCSILEQVAADGKTRIMNLYNLDMIISVGYRVNSKRATQFRIWATKILKDYLVQGYALNQKRLQEQTAQFTALQEAIDFMKDKSTYPELYGKTEEILSLLNDYSKSLTLLNQYDEGAIPLVKGKKPKHTLSYEECRDLIQKVKSKLVEKNEASDLLGREVENKFKGVLGAIYQTFDKEELYPSIEEKAANLLYLTIKDHPFTDGNKRIGSLLFLHFLAKNNYLLKTTGERKMNDNTIVALALLIASSSPSEKETMINIISNLLKR